MCFEALLAELCDPGGPDRRLASVHAAAARAHLGLASYHAGDYGRAEWEFSRALAHDPDAPGLHVLRAHVFERSGQLAEAVEDLEAALSVRPRDLEAHLLLAVCLEQQGQGKRSAAALDRAVGLEFEPPRGYAPARAAAWGTADWQRLVPELLRDARGVARDAAQKALERYQAGDQAAAVAALSRAVVERPWFADLRCGLAALLLEAGRLSEALEHLDAALAINPRYLGARLLAVRACLERGEIGAAVERAKSLPAEHPDYPDLHFWLGLARFRNGDFAEAAAALERAVALNPQFARAQRLLALVYHALGRREDALRAVRRGLMRDREAPRVALESIPPAIALGGTALSECELLRTLAITPEYPDLHLALARARRLRGDLEGAAVAYRAALALAPGYGAAALELAGVALALGQHAAAEVLLGEFAGRHPDWADAHALLGRTRWVRGDAAGAEPALRAALRLNPSLAVARADLGWVLLAQARDRDADAEFARALELDPIEALPRRQLAWRELLAATPGSA